MGKTAGRRSASAKIVLTGVGLNFPVIALPSGGCILDSRTTRGYVG